MHSRSGEGAQAGTLRVATSSSRKRCLKCFGNGAAILLPKKGRPVEFSNERIWNRNASEGKWFWIVVLWHGVIGGQSPPR
jgi:hypothetical protein